MTLVGVGEGEGESGSFSTGVSHFGDEFEVFCRKFESIKLTKLVSKRNVQLTPLKSAKPLIPSVSASESSPAICSSKTFTSPEYMNVNKATIAPKEAPGSTMTG